MYLMDLVAVIRVTLDLLVAAAKLSGIIVLTTSILALAVVTSENAKRIQLAKNRFARWKEGLEEEGTNPAAKRRGVAMAMMEKRILKSIELS